LGENVMIKENLQSVETRIQAACERAGRKREEVTLLSVSKTKPVELLQEAYDCGIREFGENKVQEICDKMPKLPPDIKWHMIGHLQRNKVRAVIDKACMIHSVDSLRLAEKISYEATEAGIIMPVLLEINIAKEETKFGFTDDEAENVLRDISRMPNLRIDGLMTSAPFVTNPEDNRVYFKAMKDLCMDLKAKNIYNSPMSVLSMGMTGDFEVAIEEGSTIVRIGTAIFGPRRY